MAIDFDAVSEVESSFAASPLSWTHTPTGTPAGVLVGVVLGAVSTDTSTGCTYGGTSMTKVGTNTKATGGEFACLHMYFLGASVPTGAQTVSFGHTGSPSKFGFAITYTASGDTEHVATDLSINGDSVDDPAETLALSGVKSYAAHLWWNGTGATANITVRSGWTRRHDYDMGNFVAGVDTYDTIGTADVTYGYTSAAADDAISIATAIREAAAAGGATLPLIIQYYG